MFGIEVSMLYFRIVKNIDIWSLITLGSKIRVENVAICKFS
jgi:hypothetical protein